VEENSLNESRRKLITSLNFGMEEENVERDVEQFMEENKF